MHEFPYEKVVSDKKVRRRFFNEGDKFVRLLMKRGLIDSAIEHAAKLKKMKEDIELIG